MHFEYPGMYNEFPFLRHSGSFGLYYDGGINAAGIEISYWTIWHNFTKLMYEWNNIILDYLLSHKKDDHA